jgi:uncharacterized YigZ family protein
MLFDDTYKTVSAPAEGIFRDRGSRFIGFIYPVSSQEEITAKLNELRKEHHGARHHCYAWRLGADGAAFRANDDGEPSGTAGKPIYNQILSAGITNALIVVVRYFGGTLLGASGLINAYKQAAIEAIGNTEIIEKQIMEIYSLQFEYAAMNDVMKILKDHELKQWNQNFGLDCNLEFSVRKSDADAVTELLRNIATVKINWLATN